MFSWYEKEANRPRHGSKFIITRLVHPNGEDVKGKQPKMASTTTRRTKKRVSSVNLGIVNYQLFEVAHVLRIKPLVQNDEKLDFVQIGL